MTDDAGKEEEEDDKELVAVAIGGGGGHPLTRTTALCDARARTEPSGDQEAAEEVYLFFVVVFVLI